MDLLDSIFDPDLLNFDEIDNLSMQIKNEPTNDYSINLTANNNIFNENTVNTSSSSLSSESASSINNVIPSSYISELPISSNSSDSGLSSDNLEM